MIPALKFTINAIAAASAISSTPAAAAVTLRTADGLILCALRRELFFFSIIKLGAVVLFFRYRPAHVPADKNVYQHGDKIDHESHAEAYKTIAAFHICGQQDAEVYSRHSCRAVQRISKPPRQAFGCKAGICNCKKDAEGKKQEDALG